jgi:hypothetical protein
LTGHDVYAVGALGTILHFDGQTWTEQESGISDRLWAVRGLPGEDPVALGARGAFLVRRDGVWQYEQIAQGRDLYGLWDNGDSALLLSGYNGLVMKMTSHARQTLNQGRTHWLTGVWVEDCDRVYAVGKRGAILQSSGDGWVDIAPNLEGVNYSAIWGAGPDDFFVTGSGGVIARFQTGVWTVWKLNALLNLEDIWGMTTDDIFAVGAGGIILHFDGVSWESMDSGTTRSLSAVHGRGSGDVYAVGLGGTILHFDGIIWRQLDSGVQTALNGVWSRPGAETIVVGDSGLVLHRTADQSGGATWTAPPARLTSFSLAAMSGTPGGDVYAVGYNGVVMRYDGAAWDIMPTEHFDPLNAIHVGPCGDIYAAGFWGLILKYGN